MIVPYLYQTYLKRNAYKCDQKHVKRAVIMKSPIKQSHQEDFNKSMAKTYFFLCKPNVGAYANEPEYSIWKFAIEKNNVQYNIYDTDFLTLAWVLSSLLCLSNCDY